jgi:hypothetical protein
VAGADLPNPGPEPLAVRREPAVYMRFGVLRLAFTDADEAQQIADAFTEAARLLREAQDGAS